MNNALHFTAFNSDSSAQEEEEIGQVCIANISPKERQIRMRFGITQLAIALITLTALLAFDVSPLWRLLLILPFGGAAAGYFQAKDKTWLSLASRGLRKFGETEEKVEDDAEQKQIQRQAQKILLKSFLISVSLAFLAYLIP